MPKGSGQRTGKRSAREFRRRRVSRGRRPFRNISRPSSAGDSAEAERKFAASENFERKIQRAGDLDGACEVLHFPRRLGQKDEPILAHGVAGIFVGIDSVVDESFEKSGLRRAFGDENRVGEKALAGLAVALDGDDERAFSAGAGAAWPRDGHIGVEAGTCVSQSSPVRGR